MRSAAHPVEQLPPLMPRFVRIRSMQLATGTMVCYSIHDQQLRWNEPPDDPICEIGLGLAAVDARHPGASASVERGPAGTDADWSTPSDLLALDGLQLDLRVGSHPPSSSDEEFAEVDLDMLDGCGDPLARHDLVGLPELKSPGHCGLPSLGTDDVVATVLNYTAPGQSFAEEEPKIPLPRSLSTGMHVETSVRALEFGDRALPGNAEEEFATKVKSAHRQCDDLLAFHTALRAAEEASDDENSIRWLHSMYMDARARIHRFKHQCRGCTEAVHVIESRLAALAPVKTPPAVLETKAGQARREWRNAKSRVSKMSKEVCGKSSVAQQRGVMARYHSLDRHINSIVRKDRSNVHKMLIDWWRGSNNQPERVRQALGIGGERLDP